MGKPYNSVELGNSGPEQIGEQDNTPESQDNDDFLDRHSFRWLQVLGSFCLNLNTWGLLGSFGVYQTHYSLKMLQGSSDSAISWIGSIQAFFMFLFSFLIGPIFDAGYLHHLLVIGTLLSLLGLFMTSICTAFWQLVLAQGVAMGIGFGCIYLPAPALVSMHFDKHQNLAMGLSSSGSGIGAIIFPLVFTRLEPRVGFSWATRALAFILIVTSIIPLVVMRYPKRVSMAKAERTTPTTAFAKRWMSSLVDTSALRDIPFVLLVTGALTTFMGIYIILYYINLLVTQRTDVSRNLASQSLTILNGASTVGRILPSALADYVGPLHILAITSLLSGVIAFCSLTLDHKAGLIVWLLAFGTFSGAFMGLPAAGMVSVSNTRNNIGKRLGMMLGIVGCGVLIAEPVAGAILGAQHGGWTGLISWSASLMVAGSLFMGAARVNKVGVRTLVKI